MSQFSYRFAKKEDLPLILEFIKELAEYEKMLDEVIATEELLNEWIFIKKVAEVIFALEDDNEVGFALFFHNFSTFLGRAGIYLEDLFVKPEYRGKGIATLLLNRICNDAELDGYKYVEAYPMISEGVQGLAFTGPKRLYEKAGFDIVEQRENLLVMRKKIK